MKQAVANLQIAKFQTGRLYPKIGKMDPLWMEYFFLEKVHRGLKKKIVC